MKIQTGHPKIKSDREFDENELKILLFLEEDPTLETDLREFRREFNLPENGFKLKRKVKSYTEFGQTYGITPELLVKKALKLVKKYGLPNYWLETFIFLILFGVAVPGTKSEYETIKFKIVGEKTHLIISGQPSIRKIKRYLDQNSRELKRMLALSPKEPKVAMTISSIKIRKRMLELKKIGKTNKQIGESLQKEYGDQLTFDPSYESIPVMIKRFKDSLKRILNTEWKNFIFSITFKEESQTT